MVVLPRVAVMETAVRAEHVFPMAAAAAEQDGIVMAWPEVLAAATQVAPEAITRLAAVQVEHQTLLMVASIHLPAAMAAAAHQHVMQAAAAADIMAAVAV